MSGFEGSAGIIEIPSKSSFEVTALDKSGPVKLLENRRHHLQMWLAQGDKEIADWERTIKETKERAVEMMAELEEIERALNVLHANAARDKEQEHNG